MDFCAKETPTHTQSGSIAKTSRMSLSACANWLGVMVVGAGAGPGTGTAVAWRTNTSRRRCAGMCSQRPAPAQADERVFHFAKAIASEIQSTF
jgi:hypothetical protein